MRRVGSTFVTLWLTLFIPSLIIWGLMLRWSESSADRFESMWRWSANLLTFPLLLDRQTDWSWSALASGSRVDAALGFLLLTVVWSTMFTLPLAIIGGWWVAIASRHTRQPAIEPTAALMYDPLPAGDAPPPRSPSPLGAIYILTIPLALLWNGARATLRVFTKPQHPLVTFLRPILIAFAVMFVLVASWYMHSFASVRPRDWNQLVSANLYYGVWFGYLDTLHIPAIFNDRWHMAMDTVYLATRGMSIPEREAYIDQWYRQAEVRELILITAARHGLGVAIVATVWQSVRRVFR